MSEHKCKCRYIGCHINDCRRWCHFVNKEIPYEFCNEFCIAYDERPTQINLIQITMTQEEKELLLKDLCARLPYEIKINVNGEKDTLLELGVDTGWVNASYDIDDVKPYLRSMATMTYEEKREFNVFGFEVIDHINAERSVCPAYQVVETKDTIEINKILDWLNAHHFDYHNLIERGLAIEAPEGMYNLKEK